MATLAFSFDTGAIPLSRIVDALAGAAGWTATILDPNTGQMIANPETKAQAAQRYIHDYIVRTVREREVTTARTTADASVTSITLT